MIVEDAGAAREDPQGPRRPAAPRARDLDGAARRRRRDQLRRAARDAAAPAPTRTTRAASHRSRARTSPPTSTRPAPPGRPKGCIIDHQNWRDMLDMVEAQNVLVEHEVAYLFLPLAHAFARLIQLGSIDVGATIVYWERDPQKIIPNLMEVKPTYFPSVPRMFEKIYCDGRLERRPTRRSSSRPSRSARRCASMQHRGEEVPAELQAAFDQADQALFQNVRNLFGGQHQAGRHRRRADRTGDPRVLLRLRRPGARGLGHDRDLDRGDAATRRRTSGSGRSASPSPASRSRSPTTARSWLRGPNIFRGYYKNQDATKRDDRRRLAAHRRHRPHRRGRLPLHHRPQEGHHHHRRRQEHHAGQPRERPQAEPVHLAGRRLRRPAALPDGADHARPRGDRAVGPEAGHRGHRHGVARARTRRSVRWSRRPSTR